MKDTSRSVLSSLCGYCLPSCQAERQAPGLLVYVFGVTRSGTNMWGYIESTRKADHIHMKTPSHNFMLHLVEKSNNPNIHYKRLMGLDDLLGHLSDRNKLGLNACQACNY